MKFLRQVLTGQLLPSQQPIGALQDFFPVLREIKKLIKAQHVYRNVVVGTIGVRQKFTRQIREVLEIVREFRAAVKFVP